MSPLINRICTRTRFIHRGLRYRFRVESAEVRFVISHLRKGQTAIDVGAHKGAFTYWLSRAVGATGRVFAFEPIPQLAGYLRHVQQTFPLRNVEVQQAALAEQETSRTLHIPRDNYIGTASFTPTGNPFGHESIDVTTYPLDLFLKSRGNPMVDFVKCDVEGHELEVLHGAKATLERCRPTLLLECEDIRNGGGQLNRVREFLRPFDYNCYAIHGQELQRYEDHIDAIRNSGQRIGVDVWRNFAFVAA